MWLIVEEELVLNEDETEDEAAASLSSGTGAPLEIDEVGLHAVQIGERVYGH